MNKLSMLTLIIPRDMEEAYHDFLSARGIQAIYSFPCSGTTSKGLLDVLGLSQTGKSLIFTAVPHKRIRRIIQSCVNDMGLNMPGSGIALAIPFESAGGMTSLSMLLGGQEFDVNEVNEMEGITYPCSLIVAIAESGNSDTVMDAARSAGAGGGTVVHAKGTAGELAQRFMGVSLAAEKEMVLIVVNQKDRRQVMRAIMDQAGVETPAHTILFSLPVETVGGLRSVMGVDPDAE